MIDRLTGIIGGLATVSIHTGAAAGHVAARALHEYGHPRIETLLVEGQGPVTMITSHVGGVRVSVFAHPGMAW